jgi:hypothetical protein
MSRFLKLTNIIINKNLIHHIDINKDKYIIHLMSNKNTGFIIYGGGGYFSYHTEFEICRKKSFEDYVKVTEWIKNDLH